MCRGKNRAAACSLVGLLALMFVIAGLTQGAGRPIAALILAPIAFLLAVILIRLWLELVIVMFRIAEHTRDIASNTRR